MAPEGFDGSAIEVAPNAHFLYFHASFILIFVLYFVLLFSKI
jgi:hypothetical protein